MQSDPDFTVQWVHQIGYADSRNPQFRREFDDILARSSFETCAAAELILPLGIAVQVSEILKPP
jgi:hypothetical protein